MLRLLRLLALISSFRQWETPIRLVGGLLISCTINGMIQLTKRSQVHSPVAAAQTMPATTESVQVHIHPPQLQLPPQPPHLCTAGVVCIVKVATPVVAEPVNPSTSVGAVQATQIAAVPQALVIRACPPIHVMLFTRARCLTGKGTDEVLAFTAMVCYMRELGSVIKSTAKAN